MERHGILILPIKNKISSFLLLEKMILAKTEYAVHHTLTRINDKKTKNGLIRYGLVD